jgi:DNA-binding transcriptional MerR regulator
MYQIGMFSKINRITTKTLRHYDEIGLLKPEFVDDFSGYRYYSNDQLMVLHKIIALKQMGLSLMEIKDIIENNADAKKYLLKKSEAIKAAIEKDKNKLMQIEYFLKRKDEDMKNNYNPIIKSLPEVIVASMRTVVPSYDTYFDIVPKMGEEMEKKKAVCAKPAYCFTIYHDGEYKKENIDVEVCEAVESYCEDSDMVKYKKVNKVDRAACVLHKGPYKTIGETYALLFNWISENGEKPIGLPRESYIDGIWNKDDESDWLTEIQIPIGK